MRRREVSAAALLALTGCAAPTGLPAPVEDAAPGGLRMPPPAPREMRGVWIATVYNIDWPSRRATGWVHFLPAIQ